MRKPVFHWAPRLILLILPTVCFAQFSPSTNSPFVAGTFPVALVTADFNGDTIPDLAIANQIAGTVTILLGDGKGGFQPNPNGPFAVGTYPSAIVAGHFNVNKDQHWDLAVTNKGSGTVTILLGDGAGGFRSSPVSPTVGQSPDAIVTADFDGDNVADLAVANIDSNTVTILFGNGDGTFKSVTERLQGLSNPSSLVAADFNGDGFPDLAVTNETGGTMMLGNLVVFLNDKKGNLALTPNNPIVVGTNPSYVVATDFNNDGYQDLAVANLNSGNLTILEGNGTGSFTPFGGAPVKVGSEPLSIAIADLNGDTFPDLAVANYHSNNVSAVFGSSTGAFTAATGSPYPAGGLPHSVAVADFNGDGKPDLAVANYNDGTVAILLNTFASSPVMVSSASGTSPVALGSFVTIYGTGLGSSTAPPTVNFTDSTGAKAPPLSLIYMSPTQIDAMMPAYAATGQATFNVSNSTGTIQTGSVMVNAVAPGLFSANANGKGVAAGEFYTSFQNFLDGKNQNTFYNCSAQIPPTCLPVALDVDSGSSVLILYGTGIRNRSSLSTVTVNITGAQVFYAGQSAINPNLDQVNISLPPTLAGSGVIFVSISIGSATSNPVTIEIAPQG